MLLVNSYAFSVAPLRTPYVLFVGNHVVGDQKMRIIVDWGIITEFQGLFTQALRSSSLQILSHLLPHDSSIRISSLFPIRHTCSSLYNRTPLNPKWELNGSTHSKRRHLITGDSVFNTGGQWAAVISIRCCLLFSLFDIISLSKYVACTVLTLSKFLSAAVRAWFR
jgi:hypothetical protein